MPFSTRSALITCFFAFSSMTNFGAPVLARADIREFAAVEFAAVEFAAVDFAASESDFLINETIQIPSPHSAVVLDRTIGDLPALFERYQPQVDSSSTIEVPLSVTGSSLHPILKLSVRKCVLFICKTVDIDGVVSLEQKTGNCSRNYNLTLDLRQSSALLTDVYDALNVAICYAEASNGQGSLALSASAHKAKSYSTGMIQQQIFSLIKLQIAPITAAINESLKANSAGL